MNSILNVDFSHPLKLQKAVLPCIMKNDREVLKYDEILFETDGKPIKLILKDSFFTTDTIGDVIHGF